MTRTFAHWAISPAIFVLFWFCCFIVVEIVLLCSSGCSRTSLCSPVCLWPHDLPASASLTQTCTTTSYKWLMFTTDNVGNWLTTDLGSFSQLQSTRLLQGLFQPQDTLEPVGGAWAFVWVVALARVWGRELGFSCLSSHGPWPQETLPLHLHPASSAAPSKSWDPRPSCLASLPSLHSRGLEDLKDGTHIGRQYFRSKSVCWSPALGRESLGMPWHNIYAYSCGWREKRID